MDASAWILEESQEEGYLQSAIQPCSTAQLPQVDITNSRGGATTLMKRRTQRNKALLKELDASRNAKDPDIKRAVEEGSWV